MEILTVTEYGTIKGNYSFKEKSIDAFIKQIVKTINKTKETIDRTNARNIDYITKVKLSGNGDVIITMDGNEYYLELDRNSKYYIELKSKFDELIEISKKNMHRQRIINDFENNYDMDKHNNNEDLQVYLKFLRESKIKYLLKSILTVALNAFGNFGIIIGFIFALSYPNSILKLPILLFGGIFSFSYYITMIIEIIENNEYNNLLNDIIKYFRITRLINLKIKNLTNKYNKVEAINKKLDSQMNMPNNPKRDIYKDEIIKYMSDIMMGANDINKKDGNAILLELSAILDEYTSRMKKYNSNKEKGLTLENERTTIMHEIIGKLTTLKMEIIEIKRRDDNNKKFTDDSEMLREKLNEYIAITSSDEVVQASNGKKRVLTQGK